MQRIGASCAAKILDNPKLTKCERVVYLLVSLHASKELRCIPRMNLQTLMSKVLQVDCAELAQRAKNPAAARAPAAFDRLQACE